MYNLFVFQNFYGGFFSLDTYIILKINKGVVSFCSKMVKFSVTLPI